jgi:hypothetical protein
MGIITDVTSGVSSTGDVLGLQEEAIIENRKRIIDRYFIIIRI